MDSQRGASYPRRGLFALLGVCLSTIATLTWYVNVVNPNQALVVRRSADGKRMTVAAVDLRESFNNDKKFGRELCRLPLRSCRAEGNTDPCRLEASRVTGGSLGFVGGPGSEAIPSLVGTSSHYEFAFTGWHQLGGAHQWVETGSSLVWHAGLGSVELTAHRDLDTQYFAEGSGLLLVEQRAEGEEPDYLEPSWLEVEPLLIAHLAGHNSFTYNASDGSLGDVHTTPAAAIEDVGGVTAQSEQDDAPSAGDLTLPSLAGDSDEDFVLPDVMLDGDEPFECEDNEDEDEEEDDAEGDYDDDDSYNEEGEEDPEPATVAAQQADPATAAIPNAQGAAGTMSDSF